MTSRSQTKSRNNERIERSNDADVDLLNIKKNRHGKLIKSQESMKNEENNISVVIEDDKKEENEKKEDDDKKEDDKIDNKIDPKIKDVKIEDVKKENYIEDNKIEDNTKKICCLRCENNRGCCICTNRQLKCSSCSYVDFQNQLKKREHIKEEIPIQKKKFTFSSQAIFPPDPYQDIELRSFHSIEKENTQILENGQTNQLVELNTPLLNRRINRRSRVNLILCMISLFSLIYLTIVFRDARGFNFRSTTSLYIMIIELFVLVFMTNIQSHFK